MVDFNRDHFGSLVIVDIVPAITPTNGTRRTKKNSHNRDILWGYFYFGRSPEQFIIQLDDHLILQCGQ